MAVQQLYPGTQVTIGPVIENGFYYDFAREEPFTDEDLSKIEKKMMEIIDQDPQTRREVWERKKAIDHFKSIGESYKAELIDAIPGNEEYQFISMEIGMIYVEDLIYQALVELVRHLN